MGKWDKLADEKTIENTIAALKANGIDAQVVENRQEANHYGNGYTRGYDNTKTNLVLLWRNRKTSY